MHPLTLAALAALVMASPPPRRRSPLGASTGPAPGPAATPGPALLPWIGPGPSYLLCRHHRSEMACGTKLFCTMFKSRHAPGTRRRKTAAECLAARQPPPPPSVVYRGDPRGPDEFRRLRGIPPKPHGPLGNESFSLQAHHENRRRFADAYVSTTSSFGVALNYALDSGHVYRVHATPNMVDLDLSDMDFKFGFEEELSALGGVRWDQVEAWMHIPTNDPIRALDGDEIHNFREPDAFLTRYPEYPWVDNDEYNSTRFGALTAGPGEPRLAGNKAAVAKYPQKTLEQWAVDFMDRNGAVVAWKGKFPLDQPISSAWGVTNRTVPAAGFPLGSEPGPEVPPPVADH